MSKQRSVSFDERTEKIMDLYSKLNNDSFSKSIFKIVKKFIAANNLERLLEKSSKSL